MSKGQYRSFRKFWELTGHKRAVESTQLFTLGEENQQALPHHSLNRGGLGECNRIYVGHDKLVCAGHD